MKRIAEATAVDTATEKFTKSWPTAINIIVNGRFNAIVDTYLINDSRLLLTPKVHFEWSTNPIIQIRQKATHVAMT
jgi:hypothetical protein